MRKCIYCRIEKFRDEFSLEHVIPQFLGGSLAPDFLKTKDVCKKCNNDLGLFVDAAFSKDWVVYNQLSLLHYDFKSKEGGEALPLIYEGVINLDIPCMQHNEMCELWCGPNQDKILWIKNNDERFVTFVGNNPRNTKSKPSRAYHFHSQKMRGSLQKTITSIKSFEAFFKNKKVKKVTFTPVSVIDKNRQETVTCYSSMDYVDERRLQFFQEKGFITNEKIHIKYSVNVNNSYRLMAKLALGISYCLLGQKGIEGKYAEELYKTLWYREGDLETGMNGYDSFYSDDSDPVIENLMSNKGAVTISVMAIGRSLGVNLSIGRMHKTVKFFEMGDADLLPNILQNKGAGFVLILYPAINRMIYRDLMDYIAYKSGANDSELDKINQQLIRS